MFSLIKDFIEFKKMKEERRNSCKRFVVGQAMIKYYEDLQTSTGKCDLPPFVLAHNAMQELKTPTQVNRIYRKLEMVGLV